MQIADDLLDVNSVQGLHGFEFNDQGVADKEIELEFTNGLSLVYRLANGLLLEAKALPGEFDGQGIPITFFRQARPEFPMHLDAGPNHLGRQIVQYLIRLVKDSAVGIRHKPLQYSIVFFLAALALLAPLAIIPGPA